MLSIPRFQLGCFPTPIHDLPVLSEDIGIQLKIKRDDLTGIAAGGTKFENWNI